MTHEPLTKADIARAKELYTVDQVNMNLNARLTAGTLVPSLIATIERLQKELSDERDAGTWKQAAECADEEVAQRDAEIAELCAALAEMERSHREDCECPESAEECEKQANKSAAFTDCIAASRARALLARIKERMKP